MRFQVSAQIDSSVVKNVEDTETAGRACWTKQMEQGYAMVEQRIAFPVDEWDERFASQPAAGCRLRMQECRSADAVVCY